MSEAQLQKKCYQWFRATYKHEHWYLWMNYNNPKNAKHGAILVGMGLLKGIADMTYLAKGNFPYFLEFKALKGSQTLDQRCWGRAIKRRGGIYVVIKTFEQFKAWIHIAQCHPGHQSLPMVPLFAEENRIDYRQLAIIHDCLWNGEQKEIPTETLSYFSQLNLQTA
jgi:VRR-NUC domain.